MAQATSFHWSRRLLLHSVVALTLLFGARCGFAKDAVMLVVMDPLAKELACACVKGYGQRDYRKLAARLESALKQPVSIEFSDDLAETLALASSGQEVLVVGEQSRVVQDAVRAKLKCQPVCALTDPDGNTTTTASFVVRATDTVKSLKDLGGRKLLHGLADTEANRVAVQAALRAYETVPAALDKRASYGDAALDVLDSSSSPLPVAVIPTYAVRLLAGCGSIKPGELRVVGNTEPLPFITVFTSDNISSPKQSAILKTLLGIQGDSKLLKALESRDGFKPVAPPKSAPQASVDWPDWRGPARDGHVPRLPSRLPATVKFIWKKAAMSGGLAGVSASGGRLILAERDFGDQNDVYRCLDANTGELLWRVHFPAHGTLDYGQSPRATPVIQADRAYVLGAFGDLRCLNVTNGQVVWHRQLIREFKAELPTWGMCSPPLLVDGLLIVNPGAPNVSLAALDCRTGQTVWTTPGRPAAYAAFIWGTFGGRQQIVGYDKNSLGGWDVKSGERLWQLVPPTEGDFNVPTPIAVDGCVLVSTENNGTRLYRFDDTGRINHKPAAEFAGLSPDTATPVVTNGRVFGAHSGLHCLDVKKSLRPVWHREDAALGDHATLVADEDRVLVITLGGELILLDAKADECTVISRLRVFKDDVEMYSHPAIVGSRLYVRAGYNVACLDLGGDEATE